MQSKRCVLGQAAAPAAAALLPSHLTHGQCYESTTALGAMHRVSALYQAISRSHATPNACYRPLPVAARAPAGRLAGRTCPRVQ